MLFVLIVPPITERVSGNTVEFEMSLLYPGTEYTVKVYAMRETAKSAATTTQFTTGKHTHLNPQPTCMLWY